MPEELQRLGGQSRKLLEQQASKWLVDDDLRLPARHRATLAAIVHGDLHFRQVLVADGSVTGIVDWVDVCRSDPAIDLSLVWSFLPTSQRAAFLEAHGEVSDEQLLRARVLAFSLCAALAAQAHAEGLIAVEREALAGLNRASR